MVKNRNEEFIGKKGIYSKKTRNNLVDSGAISNEEDGFMGGYDNPGTIYTDEEIKTEEE